MASEPTDDFGSWPDASRLQEDAAILRPLPFGFAKRHGVLLNLSTDDMPTVMHLPNTTLVTLLEVRRYVRRPVHYQEISPEVFDSLLQETYEADSSQSIQEMGSIDEDWDLDLAAQSLPEPEDLLDTQDDAPIIRLINALLAEAVKQQASDVHFEPFESRLVVRFRTDGVLKEVFSAKAKLTPLIISRVKVMARLDIAEKRLPQDGRISLRVAGRPVDVRVSTLPSSHGERVVMRLLDKQAGRLTLDSLGLSGISRKIVSKTIHKPNGIFLVTGPTGSGKTTTLYAALGELNNKERNILTVEDPIEYYIDGIGQSQVNTKADMSFARGLRAILRQDPDVVMVGEIRDLETAQIAVQASLTGHLVLSTLHTNSAVGAITRLADMGIEPFLLSSSLIGVVAQRLVRVLCGKCKEPYTASDTECEEFNLQKDNPPILYKTVGCEHCNHTGYLGRTGIYEIIAIDDTLRQLIHESASEQQIEQYARRHSPSIRQDGVEKALSGVTSVEEVLRVTYED